MPTNKFSLLEHVYMYNIPYICKYATHNFSGTYRRKTGVRALFETMLISLRLQTNDPIKCYGVKCESHVKYTMATRSRDHSFMAREKLWIIEEAENIENRAAGRKYDVSEICIPDWHRKQNVTNREE